MYYAGVGSRETPLHICELMTQIAKKLSSLGWVCRSGGAEGADLAFMRGAARLENYIAWLGEGSGGYSGIVPNLERNFEYLRDVENLNPLLYDPRTMQNPKYRGMWKLHARNVSQVLGLHLNSPCKFVLLYAQPTFTGGQGWYKHRPASCIAQRNSLLQPLGAFCCGAHDEVCRNRVTVR